MITVVISMRYERGPDWTLRFPETNTFDCNKDPILFHNDLHISVWDRATTIHCTIIIMTRLRM